MAPMSDHGTSKLSAARWENCSPEQTSRAAAAFVLALMFFRLLVLVVLPLDLSGDEAYYWDWGRHLDLGYFSKPPGIGWLMGLAGAVGGNTTFGVRMFAVFLGTGSLWFLFVLSRGLYGPGVAMIAAIAFVANPANAALNLVLTIDAPLVFFWTLSLLAFWRFIQPKTNPVAWGGLLTIGLAGGILSKQMMLVFPLMAILFLALSTGYRSQLKRPALWLCLLLSMLALVPPLVWNIQNDWLTLKHTMHHFEAGSPTLGERVGRFFVYVASQLGIITPVLWALTMAILVGAFRHWKRLGDRERFLWMFSAPGLLAMLLMGLRQRINPNWPAVFYIASTILVVGWAADKWSLQLKLDHWRRAFRPGLKLGIGMTAAVYGIVAALSFGLVTWTETDPSARLRGWSIMARDVQSARDTQPDGLMIITQSHRYLTSELAFYLPDQPRVYRYNPNPNTIGTQYDLWETPSARLGEDALIVVQGDDGQVSAELGERFEETELLQTLHYPHLRRSQRSITLFLGKNLIHWPTLRTR